MSKRMRIGVFTGGGDAPGLNAAICGLGRRLLADDHELIGFHEGWRGLVEDDGRPIVANELRDLLTLGGSVLGNSSHTPYDNPEHDIPALKATIQKRGLDAVVAIGGDGTLKGANRLWREESVPLVGVPKTIDNDLCGTDFTFGFWTAVERASQLMESLRPTSDTHRRIMVVECMGRHAGWIAAYAGVAAAAEAILVPERPCELRELFERLSLLRKAGRSSALISAAEGTRLYLDGELLSSANKDRWGEYETGGVAETVARSLEKEMGWSARPLVLGHLQRGGRPMAFDRLFALRLGAKAASLVMAARYGRMAVMQNGEVTDIDLAEAVAEIRKLSDHFLDRYGDFVSSILTQQYKT